MTQLMFGQAKIKAVGDLMRGDDRVVVLGGAAFGGLHHSKYCQPLFDEFDDRIMRTPIAELGFFAELDEHFANLGSTTVNHHRVNSDRVQQHNVLSKRTQCRCFIAPSESIPAVFDHHDGARKLADIGQRFSEQGCGVRRVSAKRTHEVVLFSSM